MVINPIVGVYIPIITIPIKGEMTIPNIGSLDTGTYIYIYILPISAVFFLWPIHHGRSGWYIYSLLTTYVLPGSSRYVKCLPFGRFFGEKAPILHTWKIQVYTYHHPGNIIHFIRVSSSMDGLQGAISLRLFSWCGGPATKNEPTPKICEFPQDGPLLFAYNLEYIYNPYKWPKING